MSTSPKGADVYRLCREYLDRARVCEAQGEWDAAWANLEAAHVLGQRHTRTHVLSHWEMLNLARRQRNKREIRGQILRMIAAAFVTSIWVPEGNSGRAHISALARAAVPRDLIERMHDPQK